MDDWRFTEIDLRRMLQQASGHREDVVETRWVIETRYRGRAWEVIVEPDPERQLVNPLGAKGIGEAATIGSTPAVVNAVVDALRSFNVRHLDMSLRPQRVWQAMHHGRA